MKIQSIITLWFIFFTSILWGQDSTIVKPEAPKLIAESIAYIQFNTVKYSANAGIQGKNISLVSFSNLSNNNFNEVHNHVNIDGYLDKKKTFAIGVYYTLDNWSNRLFQNSLGFTFKKKVKNFHLGLGFEKNTLYADTNNLVFGDMIDPRQGVIYSLNDIYWEYSSNYLNFKPSIIYSNDRLKIGVSLSNITEPNNGLVKGSSITPMETNFSASYLFQLKKKWHYTPILNFFHSDFNQLLEIHNIITFSDIRKTHFLDLSYNNQKSVSGQYGINFNNRLKFFAKINIPIYYSHYFPLSAQGGMQYSFKSKNK